MPRNLSMVSPHSRDCVCVCVCVCACVCECCSGEKCEQWIHRSTAHTSRLPVSESDHSDLLMTPGPPAGPASTACKISTILLHAPDLITVFRVIPTLESHAMVTVLATIFCFPGCSVWQGSDQNHTHLYSRSSTNLPIYVITIPPCRYYFSKGPKYLRVIIISYDFFYQIHLWLGSSEQNRHLPWVISLKVPLRNCDPFNSLRPSDACMGILSVVRNNLWGHKHLWQNVISHGDRDASLGVIVWHHHLVAVICKQMWPQSPRFIYNIDTNIYTESLKTFVTRRSVQHFCILHLRD